MGKTLFDSPSFANHEGVHAVFDEKTGLRGIIAVHSTARGPAVGGTRMWHYASIAEAKGFLKVSATPLTRSSYHADDDFQALRAARRERLGLAG